MENVKGFLRNLTLLINLFTIENRNKRIRLGGDNVAREKRMTGEILKNNMYALKLTYSISKGRVVVSIVSKIIEYLLWVFYSAFFVRFILNAIANERPAKEIFLAIGVIGLVSVILQLILFFCDDVLIPMLNTKVYHGMYRKIYKKSENVELACYENNDFYDKFSAALDGMGDKVCETVDNMGTVIGGTIGGILACYTMVKIDAWTILFLIAPFVGNFFFAPRMNSIYHHRYLDTIPAERKMQYVNRVMYMSEYVKEIRLSNIFNVLKRDYDGAAVEKMSVWKKYFNRAFFTGILQYIFSYVIIFEGILLYGAYRAIVPGQHMITFSDMAVLTSVMVTASWVWVRVINAINRGTLSSLLVTNLREFLNYKEKIPENQDGIIPEGKIQSIEFKNVSFSYDGKENNIKNISFCVMDKSSLVLVGHNGAGKTTIIKLLLRLYDPTEGKILVNGRDIREYNLAEYRKWFSCAFQDGVIMPGTVRYNVLMGNEGSDEKVISALQKAGIYKKIQSLPKNIDAVLTKEFDDEGVILSGGEQQKILVARALVKDTPVAVFDEPSSALDPISENQLFDSILHATKDRIGILISHRLSCVKNADCVLLLENGEIIERGTQGELIKEDGKYAEMYRIQERNYFALDEDEEGQLYGF